MSEENEEIDNDTNEVQVSLVIKLTIQEEESTPTLSNYLVINLKANFSWCRREKAEV